MNTNENVTAEEAVRLYPKSLGFSLRTLHQDLDLLSEDLYLVKVEIGQGCSNQAELGFDMLQVPQDTQSALRNLEHTTCYKVQPVKLTDVFQPLKAGLAAIRSGKEALYRRYTRTLGSDRVIVGKHLEAFIQDYKKLEAEARELLIYLEQEHPVEQERWVANIESLLRPQVEAGQIDELTLQRCLRECRIAFPELSRIQAGFGVQLRLERRETLPEALERHRHLQQIWAEAVTSKAIALERAAQSEVERRKAEAELEAIRAEAEGKRREQQAYERAVAYQENQIKSAVQTKITEMGRQLNVLLHRNLSRIHDKGWTLSSLPKTTRNELEQLIQGAKILSSHEQSLSALAEELTQLPIGRSLDAAEDRNTIQNLIAQLEAELAPPDIAAQLQQAQATRSAWVDWDEAEAIPHAG
ncbi:hypothetical protein [Leptolyngbya sp. 'hensonii']|uniref:hypothetical protein n=1 Tax=Leptolyngbya sp. 'hensonii' TaxID=1922337 RepID=UPI00094FD073|nr:hypothetical protein [Leptolyngbya sp. 'hensonii']